MRLKITLAVKHFPSHFKKIHPGQICLITLLDDKSIEKRTFALVVTELPFLTTRLPTRRSAALSTFKKHWSITVLTRQIANHAKVHISSVIFSKMCPFILLISNLKRFYIQTNLSNAIVCLLLSRKNDLISMPCLHYAQGKENAL